MYYIDENIKKTIRIFPDEGRQKYIRLDMNENPEGLPQEFLDKVIKNITPEFLATYPEQSLFINDYAKFIGFESNQITVTNGSDMAIRYILHTFGEKNNGEVLTVTPTFEMYDVNCNLLGLTHKTISYDENFNINVDDIINSINIKTNIVVLLNPNNPIGNIYTLDEMEQIILKARVNDAVVLIDEAYHYFCPITYVDLVNKYDNVICIRTFSKLCSLAALRLGIVISNSKIISLINNLKLTFDVNSMALLFGRSLINEPGLIDNLIEIEKKGRMHIINLLKEANYDIYYAKSNFVCIKPKYKSPNLLKEEFQKKNVLIKTFSKGFLKDYIRISTGSKQIMQLFFDILIELDKK